MPYLFKMRSYSSHNSHRIPNLSSAGREYAFPSLKSKIKSSAFSSRSDSSLTSSTITSVASRRKMKAVIVMGVALPVIAGIIGVVAWAVSAADSVRSPVPMSSSLRHPNNNHRAYEDNNYIDILESRNDLYSSSNNLHNAYSDSSDPEIPSRLDGPDISYHDDGNELMPPFQETSTKEENDPLYIVHFVPSPPPKSLNEETARAKSNDAATEVSDVLDKIRSAAKGSKSGIPQFVVFAPAPPAAGDMIPNIQPSAMNNHHTISAEKNDYEYVDETPTQKKLREEQNAKDNLQRFDDSSQNTDASSKVSQVAFHRLTHNVTTGGSFVPDIRNQQVSNVGITQPQQTSFPLTYFQQKQQEQLKQEILQQQKRQQQQIQQQQQQQIQQQQQQQIQQQQQQMQQQHQQQMQQPSGYSNQQHVLQPTNVQNSNHLQPLPQQPPYLQEPQSYPPQQQPTYIQPHQPSYIQPEPPYVHQQPQYAHQPHQQQEPVAIGRSGDYAPPIGLQLSLGGGHKPRGLLSLGGGYSPLGIIGALIKPLLPRAHANVNGKVMFGVMLENGLKLGGNRHPQVSFLG